MVKPVMTVTNWGRSGVGDWLIQRVSAVVIGAYVLWLTGYLLLHPQIGYVEWYALMAFLPVKIFTLLMLVAVAAHAWIGLWTITTDYIKPAGWRLGSQLILASMTFVYFVWAVLILWRV